MSYRRYTEKLFPWFRQRNHRLHRGLETRHKRAKAEKDRAHAILKKYNNPDHFSVFKKDAVFLQSTIQSARFLHARSWSPGQESAFQVGRVNAPYNLLKVMAWYQWMMPLLLSLVNSHFSRLCALAIMLERLIHDYALMAYTSKTFSIELILRVTVFRLLRMQPKADTPICFEI